MNKTELAAKVAQATQESNTKAAASVNAVFESITAALAAGEEVGITGFGRFQVAERAARVGRDPRSGAKVDIPAKRVVKFKPGQDLKSRLQPAEPPKKAKSK